MSVGIFWSRAVGLALLFVVSSAHTADTSGQPLAPELLVSTTPEESADDPGTAVAVGADGAAMMIWRRSLDYAQYKVIARLLTADGQILGEEFPVHEEETGYFGEGAAAAALPGGQFVAAWSGSTLYRQSQVHVRRFDRIGGRLGTEVVLGGLDEYALVPYLAANAAGDFVVAWVARYGSDSEPSYRLRAEVFAADGAVMGSPSSIELGSQNQFAPGTVGVGIAADSSYAVAWNEVGDNYRNNQYLRCYDAQGTQRGQDLLVNPITPDKYFSYTSLAMHSSGAMEMAGSGTRIDNLIGKAFTEIYLRSLPAGCQAIGMESVVNEDPAARYNFLGASVAVAPASAQVVVGWQRYNDDEQMGRARLIEGYDGGLSQEFPIAGPASQMGVPLFGFQPSGNFWAAWGGVAPSASAPSNEIFARLFSGFHAAPSLAVTDYLAFGDQPLGASQVLPVAVVNDGSVVVEIGAMSIDGLEGSDFRLWSNSCPTSLQPQQSCSVEVSFTPSADGLRSASLRIASDASDSPDVVSLGGRGVSSTLQVSPATLDFGEQLRGSESEPKSITLTAKGSTSIQIDSVALSGPASTDFTVVTDACSLMTLQVGASCELRLVFKPGKVGDRAAALEIVTTANPASVTVSLLGTGVAPMATAPAGFHFGDQTVGDRTKPKDLSITNFGGGSLVISGFNMTGPYAADFVIDGDDCDAPLTTGQSCRVTVAFKPTWLGIRASGLNVLSNSENGDLVISLSGVGTEASLSVTPGQLQFGNRAVNSRGPTKSLSVRNTGKGKVSINTLVVGDNAADFTIVRNACGTPLEEGQSCVMEVTFRPGYTGSRVGEIHLSSNAPGTAAVVPLSGYGTGYCVQLLLSPICIGY